MPTTGSAVPQKLSVERMIEVANKHLAMRAGSAGKAPVGPQGNLSKLPGAIRAQIVKQVTAGNITSDILPPLLEHSLAKSIPDLARKAK